MSRGFADVLRELSRGETYEQLGTELADVVAAVIETRKVGTVTIKLKIKANGENSVIITDDVKCSVPEMPRGETVFFATSGGSLMRDDPRQQKLELHQVPGTSPRLAVAEAGE